MGPVPTRFLRAPKRFYLVTAAPTPRSGLRGGIGNPARGPLPVG